MKDAVIFAIGWITLWVLLGYIGYLYIEPVVAR